MGAKSRVNPANILILRSFPRTSERMMVLPSLGADVEGESFEGGIAGPRFFSAIGFWWAYAATARFAVSSE